MKNMSNNRVVSAPKSTSKKAAAPKAKAAKKEAKQPKAAKATKEEAKPATAQVAAPAEAKPVTAPVAANVAPAAAGAASAPKAAKAPVERPAAVPGAKVVKLHKGIRYEVEILADGKRCTVNGTEYPSLSAAVVKVVDQHMSGQKFWGFTQGKRTPKKGEPAPAAEEAKTEPATEEAKA